MQTETKFKQKVIPRLKTLPNVWLLKTQEMGRCGTPDILMSLSGIFVAIELKTETGKVSKLQEYNLDIISSTGAIAMVMTPGNFDKCFLFLETLSKESASYVRQCGIYK